MYVVGNPVIFTDCLCVSEVRFRSLVFNYKKKLKDERKEFWPGSNPGLQGDSPERYPLDHDGWMEADF